MKKVKKILFILVILSITYPLVALELKQGKARLVLHERTGRFSAYYLTDVQRNRYTPLLLDDDPRTTVMSLLVDNKVYRMGESFDFNQTIQKTDEGADFIWKSGFLEVRESFKLISSAGSSLSDGFSITVTIKNTSEGGLNVGMRYLMDTYLGEEDNTHFSTPARSTIQEETDFKGSIPAYIVSAASSKEPAALQFMITGPGITKPDRVVLANWKRLNNSSWNYESSASRNFNLLPYSINDSAVGLYYNPVQLPPKGERTITMAFGNYSESGYALTEQTDEEISELYTKTLAAADDTEDPVEIARTDLLTIEELLTRIDRLIMAGEEVEQEQIDAIAQIVQSLENRKNRHEERR